MTALSDSVARSNDERGDGCLQTNWRVASLTPPWSIGSARSNPASSTFTTLGGDHPVEPDYCASSKRKAGHLVPDIIVSFSLL